MTAACRNVYNFAPSFAYFVPNYIGKILTRDYNKDTINLSDISVHNGIEHDASLTADLASFLRKYILRSRVRVRELPAEGEGAWQVWQRWDDEAPAAEAEAAQEAEEGEEEGIAACWPDLRAGG